MADEQDKSKEASSRPGGKFGLEIASAEPAEAGAATEVGQGGFSDALARLEGAKSGEEEKMAGRQDSSWGYFSLVSFITLAAAAGACVMFYMFYKGAALRMERMDAAMEEFSRALSQERKKSGQLDAALLRMELGRSLAALNKVIALKDPLLTAEAAKLKVEVARAMAQLDQGPPLEAAPPPAPPAESASAPEPEPAAQDSATAASPATNAPQEQDAADPAPATAPSPAATAATAAGAPAKVDQGSAPAPAPQASTPAPTAPPAGRP